MSKRPQGSEKPHLAAVCGLYCGACSVYIATREDPERLRRIAALLGQTVEETRCEGCHAQVRASHCRNCRLAACARERGYAFCGECREFPCSDFEAFRTAKPHRNDILPDMARILSAGAEAWLEEIPSRYACPACATPNSAYDLACRRCGHEPGSPYAASHGAAIRRHLGQS